MNIDAYGKSVEIAPNGGFGLDRHTRLDVAGRRARRADLRSGRRLEPAEGLRMRRITRPQQHKRHTLPASRIKQKVGHDQVSKGAVN